jgi:hypothetical protein
MEKQASTVLLTGKDKKAKKELVTMVINDLKSSMGQKMKSSAKDKDDGDDEELYNLVRGRKSTMMIRRLDEEEDNYVPSKRVVMMISSDESEDGDYSPVHPDLPEEPEEDLNRVSEQPKQPELEDKG